MLALVTGGNGFIGSNIVKRLIDEGCDVNVLVRKTSDLKFLEGLPVNYFYGDIIRPGTIEPAVAGVEKVFHVAGLAADYGPYQNFEKVNYEGTINVAKASDKAGVKRFVQISTVAFHGFGKTNMTEDSPVAKKLIPYAKTKYMAEQWLWDFSGKSEMEITAVRPGNVFGINDRTFISKYIDALLKGKFAEINKGRSKTCPVYVENLVDIIMLVSKDKKAVNNAYIATDGLDITWHEFNSLLASKLGIEMPKTSIPYGIAMAVAKVYYGGHKLLGIKSEPFLTPYRINNGGKDYHFSIDKLKEHFGYKPATGLDEALERTVKWYRNVAK
jgi:nucleoside-diphosphate-sugar epimerase